MKIQVTEMVKKEVEIQFPCYVKSQSGFHYYHAISEKLTIQIFNGYEAGYSIGSVNMQLAFQDGFQIIKGAEYKEVLNHVLKTLSL